MSEDHRLCETYKAAIEILEKPWNGMIIAVLARGPLRFGEISEQVESIGDRMLAARLKELESRGVIVREVEPGPPVRVSYALTDVGRGFPDVAEAISRWGQTLLHARECPNAGSAACTHDAHRPKKRAKSR